jgi:hypothetical protein
VITPNGSVQLKQHHNAVSSGVFKHYCAYFKLEVSGERRLVPGPSERSSVSPVANPAPQCLTLAIDQKLSPLGRGIKKAHLELRPSLLFGR